MASISPTKVKYEVFGPYPFNRSVGVSHAKALQQLWEERKSDGSPEGLNKAAGVYVWTVHRNGSRLPWNVGITNRSFTRRFKEKDAKFSNLLLKDSSARIELFLLAPRLKNGKFAKTTHSINDWLETLLIGAAIINTNSELENTAKSTKLRKIVVDGYLNDKPEERNEAAISFNKLFTAGIERN